MAPVEGNTARDKGFRKEDFRYDEASDTYYWSGQSNSYHQWPVISSQKQAWSDRFQFPTLHRCQRNMYGLLQGYAVLSQLRPKAL